MLFPSIRKNILENSVILKNKYNFAIWGGVVGKERLRRRLKFMSVLTLSCDRNVEVSKVSKDNMQCCSRYGLITPFSKLEKVSIYLRAWAIVILLADGSFHNLYPVIDNSSHAYFYIVIYKI